MLTALGIFLFFATLVIDLYTDLKVWNEGKNLSDEDKIKQGKVINHTRGALLRLIGLAPACWLLGWQSILLVGFLYWFLFDGIFNTQRKFNWWFTGSEDTSDAETDNFLQRLSLWQHIALKLGGIAAGTAILILL